MKKTNGITLIALIITIILMLILASITVTVAINGGLFEYAGGAKDSTEIANEKDIVSEAFAWAESNSKTGRITVEELQRNLDTEKSTAVIDNGDSLVVKFNESNRYYEIEPSGKIEGPKEFLKEDYAGDLSKGNKYDGKTDETAFRITCIEDLVEFSKNYNKYLNSYIKLERTLDFKSMFSYNDYTSKAYGDLNKDGNIDDIRTELTKQGENCIGFTPINRFSGTFDGQNNKICNLYENVPNGVAGLFGICNGTIKNLGLKNVNITGTSWAGGIVGNSYANITNCFVEGTNILKGPSGKGLIAGIHRNVDIENCYSIGKAISLGTGGFGGIIGQAQDMKIKKCFNIMEIKAEGGAAGIISIYQKNIGVEGLILTIEECYHIGDITGGANSESAGIVGGYAGGIMKNCYSIGNINGKANASGMSGYYSRVDYFNCYSVGEIIGTKNRGAVTAICYGGHILHCFARRGDLGELPEKLELSHIKKYMASTISPWQNGDKGAKAQIGTDCNILTDEEMKTQSFVDELNILKTADAEGVITESAQSVWKMDTEGINGGYPIFTWQTKGKTKY